jgi:hypothetical protein
MVHCFDTWSLPRSRRKRGNDIHRSVRSIFLVGSSVFRQETTPGKFAAFASFHETRPVAVGSAMLRVGSVAVMSAGANASWLGIRSDRWSRFFDCHLFFRFLSLEGFDLRPVALDW